MKIVSELIGAENILSVPKLLVRLTGDLIAAIMVSQIIAWQKEPDRWVEVPYSRWEEEFGLSEYKVRRTARYLQELGIGFEVRIIKRGDAPRVHYHIVWPVLEQRLLDYLAATGTDVRTSESVRTSGGERKTSVRTTEKSGRAGESPADESVRTSEIEAAEGVRTSDDEADEGVSAGEKVEEGPVFRIDPEKISESILKNSQPPSEKERGDDPASTPRFTPTRVGKTKKLAQQQAELSVHPHACGENECPMPHGPGGKGFTPTRVGKT